jgi:hypothetical protein
MAGPRGPQGEAPDYFNPEGVKMQCSKCGDEYLEHGPIGTDRYFHCHKCEAERKKERRERQPEREITDKIKWLCKFALELEEMTPQCCNWGGPRGIRGFIDDPRANMFDDICVIRQILSNISQYYGLG